MGARTILRRDDSAIRRKENLTFWTITAAIGLPMILAVFLVALDMRTDLSELKAAGAADDKGILSVGWPDLREGRGINKRVRMIGYMMDDFKPISDGARADTFVLLPEAGQFLHPAHRIPNQMVVVWTSYPVAFKRRELVWATGNLNPTLRRSGENQAAYAMIFAEVTPAAERDIGKWFHP